MCDLHDHHGPLAAARGGRIPAGHGARARVHRRRARADRGGGVATARVRADQPAVRGAARRSRVGARVVPGAGTRQRDGRRHRTVADVPRRGPVAVAVQPGRAAGAMTPVHDHLAWGLVGVYRGVQDEEFYRPGDGRLALLRRRPVNPGDFYTLLPPRDDVHRVRTTSEDTSVSIHLLANDTGCVWRHTYDEQTGEASPFRSGYVNAECESQP